MNTSTSDDPDEFRARQFYRSLVFVIHRATCKQVTLEIRTAVERGGSQGKIERGGGTAREELLDCRRSRGPGSAWL